MWQHQSGRLHTRQVVLGVQQDVFEHSNGRKGDPNNRPAGLAVLRREFLRDWLAVIGPERGASWGIVRNRSRPWVPVIAHTNTRLSAVENAGGNGKTRQASGVGSTSPVAFRAWPFR